MAADAVDAGAEELPKLVQPSCTDRVPLLGADGYFAMRNQIDTPGRRVRPASVSRAARARPLRLDDPRRARAGPGRSGAAADRPGRARLPDGRDPVRGDARGRAAPGGRADPAHPHLDRIPAPGGRLGRRRRRADRRPSSTGTARGACAKSTSTGPGSRPSANRRPRPTTPMPTRCARSRRMPVRRCSETADPHDLAVRRRPRAAGTSRSRRRPRPTPFGRSWPRR